MFVEMEGLIFTPISLQYLSKLPLTLLQKYIIIAVTGSY
ncbi:hypothetical protein SAMN05444483_10221 [Salegentibacter echinorum]|uniref:Uncharacterized protein n=1 Tax=Salegentibacter echinorum TaxID=1073325 RepID=A0A1M5DM74_SALEC|nr:hypothetical protein SAMN05444483_10221 [Salegentibacter echinorum]